MAVPAKMVGFKEADPSIVKRLLVAVESLEKEGKTHFALTAPGPIAVFDFDTGMEGVVSKFAKTKKIYVSDYRRLGDAMTNKVENWLIMWEKFKREYIAALEEPTIKTVVMDTATEVWELLRMARFGKLTQVMPYHYGPVNAEYRELLRKAYSTNKNLILLHKMKDEYVKDQRTGNLKRSGFGDTGYMVQVNLRMWRDEDNNFHMFVKDNRQAPELTGMDFINEMANFTTLATMTFPGTVDKDWL
jgi:hypothetical protein